MQITGDLQIINLKMFNILAKTMLDSGAQVSLIKNNFLFSLASIVNLNCCKFLNTKINVIGIGYGQNIVLLKKFFFKPYFALCKFKLKKF